MNSKRASSNEIPRVMKYDSSEASDLKGVCELFSQYFCSVFEDPVSSNTLSTVCRKTSSNCLSHIVVSEEEICKKLKSLDEKKGPGPDGIPPLIFKVCADELSFPLFI